MYANSKMIMILIPTSYKDINLLESQKIMKKWSEGSTTATAVDTNDTVGYSRLNKSDNDDNFFTKESVKMTRKRRRRTKTINEGGGHARGKSSSDRFSDELKNLKSPTFTPQNSSPKGSGGNDDGESEDGARDDAVFSQKSFFNRPNLKNFNRQVSHDPTLKENPEKTRNELEAEKLKKIPSEIPLLIFEIQTNGNSLVETGTPNNPENFAEGDSPSVEYSLYKTDINGREKSNDVESCSELADEKKVTLRRMVDQWASQYKKLFAHQVCKLIQNGKHEKLNPLDIRKALRYIIHEHNKTADETETTYDENAINSNGTLSNKSNSQNFETREKPQHSFRPPRYPLRSSIELTDYLLSRSDRFLGNWDKYHNNWEDRNGYSFLQHGTSNHELGVDYNTENMFQSIRNEKNDENERKWALKNLTAEHGFEDEVFRNGMMSSVEMDYVSKKYENIIRSHYMPIPKSSITPNGREQFHDVFMDKEFRHMMIAKQNVGEGGKIQFLQPTLRIQLDKESMSDLRKYFNLPGFNSTSNYHTNSSSVDFFPEFPVAKLPKDVPSAIREAIQVNSKMKQTAFEDIDEKILNTRIDLAKLKIDIYFQSYEFDVLSEPQYDTIRSLNSFNGREFINGVNFQPSHYTFRNYLQALAEQSQTVQTFTDPIRWLIKEEKFIRIAGYDVTANSPHLCRMIKNYIEERRKPSNDEDKNYPIKTNVGVSRKVCIQSVNQKFHTFDYEFNHENFELMESFRDKYGELYFRQCYVEKSRKNRDSEKQDKIKKEQDVNDTKRIEWNRRHMLSLIEMFEQYYTQKELDLDNGYFCKLGIKLTNNGGNVSKGENVKITSYTFVPLLRRKSRAERESENTTKIECSQDDDSVEPVDDESSEDENGSSETSDDYREVFQKISDAKMSKNDSFLTKIDFK